MIRINRIKIQNFRQYKNVDIRFDDDKGIYLFIGKNGMGKSNFLNAICWCLYDELPFKSHDSNIKNEPLLNDEVAAINKFDPIEVTIEVEIDKEEIVFTRTWREVEGNPQNQKFEVARKVGGDWAIVPNPTYVVDSFLPKSLRQFFMFDGEGVKNLFKGNYASNLKNSIWEVSNVDLINSAISHISTVAGDLQKAVSKQLPQLGGVQEHIAALKIEINTKEKEAAQLSLEKSELDNKFKIINEKFSAYAEARSLQARRNGLTAMQLEVRSTMKEVEDELRVMLVSNNSFLILRNQLTEFAVKVNEGKKKGQIPASIRPQLIHELIEGGVCVCGRDLEDEDNKHLSQLLALSEQADAKDFLLEDSFQIGTLLRKIAELPGRFALLRTKKLEQDKKLADTEREIKEVTDKLAGHENVEIGNIEVSRDMIRDDAERCSNRLYSLTQGLVRSKEELAGVEAEYSKILAGAEKLEQEKAQLQLLENAEREATTIRDQVIDQIRKAVSYSTNKYFRDLMWKDDFEKIQFSDDYHIEIRKRNVEQTLDQTRLSNGETKVLGLAAIKALTELSGFQNFPAFIDAPVEQLDAEVEDNLLNLLPRFMPDKQVFVFSLDSPAIVEFGQTNVDDKKFFRLTRNDTSTSTKIVSYK